jgi:hypothetical protein
MKSRALILMIPLLMPLGAAGCHHYGPPSITADRIPYNHAVATSWKEQTLLNIVRLRYLDTIFFVDVPQITSGYTIQGVATTNGGIFPPVNPAASFAQELGATLNLQAGYQDRPTISYTPQTGSQFIRNLTAPINPGSVLFLIQSGYPTDVVFNLTVDSINGVKNQSVSGVQLRPADPEYLQVVQTLRKAQLLGHVGIRVERDPDKKESVAFTIRDKDVDPELALELAQVRKLLRLDPSRADFRVTFGGAATSPNEISILSRSVFRIMQELSAYVEVPVDDLVKGNAPLLGEVETGPTAPFRVLCGCQKPPEAFASICYEGHWFWIERSDMSSKRTMTSLLILLALADTGTKENLPVITIQAN